MDLLWVTKSGLLFFAFQRTS